ncbi:MAG TPA: hypothetical protein VFW07_28590 [Parafilimonas sp.]|nr:hypothetical protein [Parafilimonas sp.]
MMYVYLVYTLSAVLIVLIALKTYLFFYATTNKTFDNWFFFSSYAVYNSRSDKSKKAKQLQNRLTIFIICIAIIDILLIFLFRSYIF